MGYYSPKLPVKEYGRKVPSVMATDLHIDDPKNYTFHSYRMPAATAVVDARATSDQMKDFLIGQMPKLARNIYSAAKQPLSRSPRSSRILRRPCPCEYC